MVNTHAFIHHLLWKKYSGTAYVRRFVLEFNGTILGLRDFYPEYLHLLMRIVEMQAEKTARSILFKRKFWLNT